MSAAWSSGVSFLALAVLACVAAGAYRSFRYAVGGRKALGLLPVGLWLLAIFVLPFLLMTVATTPAGYWTGFLLGQVVAATTGIALYRAFDPVGGS